MPEETPVTAAPTPPEFPTAVLRPRKPPLRQLLMSSRMWLITLAALLVAGYFAWQSMEQTGPQITIHFPEGHGLKVGDFVRHRGIDVGHVDRIVLADDLQRIEVGVTLLAGAEAMAREGTRFWIVRPQLSLTEVRGLDTAIGAKYIAVAPGDAGGKLQLVFDGLGVPPPGELDERGMEIVLRGDNSFGLYPGAPVAWRGVDVGEVLSVDLASDTRYVDIRARIDASYRNLVRSNSQFWATSGLGIDAGFTGFTLKAESLATIARGGVSFITPADDNAQRVRPGQVFTLHAEEDAQWTEDASTVSLIDFPLPDTIKVRCSWKEKAFGFTRRRDREYTALVVSGRDGKPGRLIAPDEAFRRRRAVVPDSWSMELWTAGGRSPVLRVPVDAKVEPLGGGVSSCQIALNNATAEVSIAADRLRSASTTEDCCLVRSVSGDEGPSSVIHPLSRTELSAVGNRWRVETSGADLDDWHGAAVVSAGDGAVIGMFLATDAGPVVSGIAD